MNHPEELTPGQRKLRARFAAEDRSRRRFWFWLAGAVAAAVLLAKTLIGIL